MTGLEGATFLDETEGCARKRAGAEPRVLRGETDRVYDDTRAMRNICRGAGTVAPGAGHRLSIRIQSGPWDGA